MWHGGENIRNGEWRVGEGIRRWVPNALTGLRLVVGLLFYWLSPALWGVALAVAVITEVLDGQLSRRWKTTSDFGRLFDPVADKVFVAAVLVTLWNRELLSIAEIALIAVRDLAVVAGGVLLAVGEGWKAVGRLRARRPGKIATAFQFVVVLVVVIWRVAPTLLVVATGVAGAVAAVDYGRAVVATESDEADSKECQSGR